MSRRALFVHPAFVQATGMEPVFDTIEEGGFNGICITARVAVPNRGKRFPPLHGDGHKRVLSQPLWGRRSLNLGFVDIWADDAPDADIPRKMVDEAHGRGWAATAHLQPLVNSANTSADLQRRPDGSVLGADVGRIGCPTSPHVLDRALSELELTLESLPDLDGLVFDWVEYGAYRYTDLFGCLCDYCFAALTDAGEDTDVLRRQLLNGGQENGDARFLPLSDDPGHPFAIIERSKSQSVRRFLQALTDIVPNEIETVVRCWPPPFNRFAGTDYRSLLEAVDRVAPKLFFFDLAAVPGWYGTTIREIRHRMDEHEVLTQLLQELDLIDDREVRRIEDYVIPGPKDWHHVPMSTYADLVAGLISQFGSERLSPFIHSYLPDQQWEELLALLRPLTSDVWVHMYGYLNEHKLSAMERSYR